MKRELVDDVRTIWRVNIRRACSVLCAEQRERAFSQRIEHGLGVRRRTGNDLEDFCRGTLMLQSGFEFCLELGDCLACTVQLHSTPTSPGRLCLRASVRRHSATRHNYVTLDDQMESEE